MYCVKSTEDKPETFAANVGKACIGSTSTNTCFNDLYRGAVNTKRALHGAPDLTLDSGTDDLQTKLTTLAGEAKWKKGAIDLPTESSTGLAKPANRCQDVFYKLDENDTSIKADDLMRKALGSDQWYGYKSKYDFKTGKNKYADKATKAQKTKTDTEADALKNMLWKAHTTVGFAVSSPWVVGRFCQPASPPPRAKRTAVDNVENVKDICKVKDA